MAELHSQAERDYMLGMKYKDIAEKYNVALDTVKKWKTRYKWTRDKKNSVHKEKCTQVGKNSTPKKPINKLPVKVEHVTKEDDGLTEKQRFFCICYVKNFNATMAAIKAGFSKNTASEQGYQLLQKTSVRNEVERLKNIKRQSIMISEDDIVERYMRIAFADMTDFTEFGTESYPVVDEAGNMLVDDDGNIIYRKRGYLDFKDHTEVDGGLICEISVGRQGMKVKLEDRQKALSWLSDYFCMNPMNQHKVRYNNAMLVIKQKELDLKDW